jgi:rsbT co-antagonist protein RsbR
MVAQVLSQFAKLVAEHGDEILAEWIGLIKIEGGLETGRINQSELQVECRNFLGAFSAALAKGGSDVDAAGYEPVRDILGDLSRSRAIQGFTPTETASFVFSLKRPFFNALNRASETRKSDKVDSAQASWSITLILDRLGLYTMEVYQKTREEVIARQSREIAELSTPVVKLADGILAIPLIGTLDSERTQVVMENLLQAIVDQQAEVAIIDITGVPTVDTLTAQHLLKTVAAARLMGADCIISGIRPQIAQTLVHLGVELNVVSKATLADALQLAFQRVGRMIVRVQKAASGPKS